MGKRYQKNYISAAGEYGLPVPTVEVFDDMFRVNLYRNVPDNVNGGDNFGDKAHIRKNGWKLTNTQKKILDCIAEDKYISAKKIAEKNRYVRTKC